MLGLLLIYFVGKRFYDLAVKYDKNKWLFAILGVVSYYATVFIIQMIIFSIYLVQTEIIDFDRSTELIVGFASIPFGLAACWGFYMFLQKKWKKGITVSADSIDDIGKPLEEN